MDEQTTFEARAVLAPRQKRRSRLALLVPMVALAGIALAGVSGPRPDATTADATTAEATSADASTLSGSAAASIGPAGTPAAPPPAQVIGFDVHRLDEVQPRSLGPDDIIAISGWYVATTLNDCPPLVVIFREAAPPGGRDGADAAAFCDRTGVLYASPPDVQDSWSGSPGLGAIGVSVIHGVVMPPELEAVGADATEVILVGHFVAAGEVCGAADRCSLELVVDHVGWSAGA